MDRKNKTLQMEKTTMEKSFTWKHFLQVAQSLSLSDVELKFAY